MATQTLPLLPDDQAKAVHRALQDLARGLTQAFTSLLPGDPEDQLKSHMRPFFEAAAAALGFRGVVVKTESRVADIQGRPDVGVAVINAPTGHVELKAPGRGANPNQFKGHDRQQWNNFKNLPNLIYTDGLEWTLFRTGKRVCLSGHPTSDGDSAVTMADAPA